jgi:hypothetical protein
MVCGLSVPCDEESPPACQGSLCTRGHRTRPICALSPCPTIGKEHRSVMPTCPTTGILTARKVTIRCQLVVPSSNNNDNLPLVKHDAWVDLNPAGVSIRYTQGPALMSDLPLPSLPPYIYISLCVLLKRKTG